MSIEELSEKYDVEAAWDFLDVFAKYRFEDLIKSEKGNA